MTDPRRFNPDQRAKGPDDATTNKYSHENFYEFARARNRDLANRTRRDHAELRAMEGLAPLAAPPFYQSVHDADTTTRYVYDVVRAGQADGRREPGASNPPAHWEFVPEAALSAFSQAADLG